MIPRSIVVASLMIAAGVLAGCTASKPLALDSTIDFVDRVVRMGYPAPTATDRHGQPLDVPLDESTPKSVQVLLDWEGSNPWVGVNAANTYFMTAFEKIHKSTDRGQNWTLAKEFDRESFPNLEDRDYSFETAAALDAETGRVFLYHSTYGIWEPSPNLVVCRVVLQTLGLPCNYLACPSLYYSDDEGGNWTEPLQGKNPPPLSCTNPAASAGFSSHPKLLSAPRTDPPTPSVGDQGPNGWTRALYLCDTVFEPGAGLFITEPIPPVPPVPKCSVSFDSGHTWERTTVVTEDGLDLLEVCQTYNVGQPVADKDGIVYVPLWRLDILNNRVCRPYVAYTEDEGLTWKTHEYDGPSDNGTNWDIEPQVAVSPDGKTQYFVYRAHNQGVYLLRSDERFAEGSWEGPFRVSPASHTLDMYVAVTAGSQGRLGLAYLGTRDWQDDSLRQPIPPRADPNSVWYGFLTTTFNADDDEPVFLTDQVTTNQDAVQVGCTGAQVIGPGIPHSILADLSYCRNQLNAIWLTTDHDGRLVFGFTDGCDPRNDCTTDFSSGFQARDRQLSLSVQSSGLSIFEDKVLEDLKMQPPQPKPKCEDQCEPTS